jgi:pimeloyl-ACP methyl ester carboxylesterase
MSPPRATNPFGDEGKPRPNSFHDHQRAARQCRCAAPTASPSVSTRSAIVCDDGGVNEIQYLDLHGERVAYRDAGTGEALLLIHGMAGSSATWRAIIPQLSKKYRVVAPDLLGHGQSAKPRGDYSLGAFAVWLRDLLDELGLTRVTVVGHSLGGGVAMQFTYQHPDYCQRLVLISSGGLGPDVGWILRLLSAPGAELVLPIIAPQPVLNVGNTLRSWFTSAGIRSPRAGEIWNAYSSLSDRQTRHAFLRTLRSVVDYRGQAVSALNRLQFRSELPTLTIWGELDSIIPVDHGHAAHAARPDSRLEVLAGVGHFPQVECPTAVVEILDDFISTSGGDNRTPQHVSSCDKTPENGAAT